MHAKDGTMKSKLTLYHQEEEQNQAHLLLQIQMAMHQEKLYVEVIEKNICIFQLHVDTLQELDTEMAGPNNPYMKSNPLFFENHGYEPEEHCPDNQEWSIPVFVNCWS
jgi:hypothetical protein